MVCLSVILSCYRITCLWFVIKKGGLFMPGPVFIFPNTMFNKLLRNAQGNSCVSEVLILSLLCPTVLSVIHAANSLRAFCMCPASDEPWGLNGTKDIGCGLDLRAQQDRQRVTLQLLLPGACLQWARHILGMGQRTKILALSLGVYLVP